MHRSLWCPGRWLQRQRGSPADADAGSDDEADSPKTAVSGTTHGVIARGTARPAEARDPNSGQYLRVPYECQRWVDTTPHLSSAAFRSCSGDHQADRLPSHTAAFRAVVRGAPASRILPSHTVAEAVAPS